MTKKIDLSTQIIMAMLLGAGAGFALKAFPLDWQSHREFIESILNIGGQIFLNLMKMIVVPLVFVSLVCGICSLDDMKKVGRIGIKSLGLFFTTTVIAVVLGVVIANVTNVGAGVHLPTVSSISGTVDVPSIRDFFINIFPSNPIQALANANMLQIIVFAILLGLAINLSSYHGKRIKEWFDDINVVITNLVMMLMYLVPYGVFCLITLLFAQSGLNLMLALLGYCAVALFVIVLHAFVVYGFLLQVIGKLNVVTFLRKLRAVMLFAFTTSSSNATLPLAIKTVENKLGVDRAVASFTLPLGVNINKNGSAIVEAIAVIFISHVYNIDIGLMGDLMVVLTVILIAVGTAGTPSAGIFMLVVVLKQVGLPVEAIALIIGVDRILDMVRTVLNLIGNAAISCVVAKSEKSLDEEIYNA